MHSRYADHSDRYDPEHALLDFGAPTRAEAERDAAEDRARPQRPPLTPAQQQAQQITGEVWASLLPEVRGTAPWASVDAVETNDARPGVYRVVLGRSATPATVAVVADHLATIYGPPNVQPARLGPVIWIKTDRTPPTDPPF